VDDRAVAFKIFDVMILGLGTFALVYAASYGAVTELFNASAAGLADEGSTSAAATGAGYAAQAFRYLPFFALAAAAFALVAGAVAERRVS